MEDRTGLLQSKMLVGDRWIEESDGGVMTHLNPATGQPHKTFPVASAKEVGESVDAAREAFESWRRFEPDARRDVLRRIAALIRQREDEIGSIMSQESGSLYSPYNARYVAEWFDYYAGWADKISGEQIRAYPSNGLDYTIPEPVGVVAALVTWNGPLGFCGMAGAPALAAGCTIVVKSPELAPFSPVTFGEVCLDAGLPPGVVNVIHGGPDVGDSLIRHPEVDKVTFTGGTATAKKIQVACAETLTPLVMELGGKSANIVFDDAGIERSINLASRFTGASGQGCSLPTRLLVQDTVYDEVVAGVVERVESVVVGDPFSPETTMGPVISEQACSRILRMIGDGVRDGASLLTGGKRLGGPLAEGFFLAPTVLGDVDPATAIAQQEIFGPVLCVMRFHDESEAVAMANATPYGLAAYVQTSDFARKEDDRVAPGGQRPHQRERAGTRVAVLAVRWGEAQWIWPSRRH